MNRIAADMRLGRNLLARIFPKAEVALHMAKLLPRSTDKFELTELS
jgi:hypothetical protein